MLPRTTAGRRLPLIVKVLEGGSVTSRVHWSRHFRDAFRSSSSCVNTLPQGTTTPGLRLWRRTLWQGHHQHYHLPFTISRMCSSSLVPASQHHGPVSMSLWMLPNPSLKECHVRLYSSRPPHVPSSSADENNETKTLSTKEDKGTGNLEQAGAPSDPRTEEKLSIVQKFKLMYKQYWYVLIPVHIVTSIVWYGSFFIAAKSGVDIIPLMEKLGAGEKILSHLQSSDAGYYAIAYAMYKIATPARYTVTVGGTTISINYLKKRGYIKPVPSSEKLKEMYEGKKEEFIEKRDEIVEKYQEKREEIVDKYQEKKGEFIDRYQGKKDEIKGRYQEKRDELRERVTEKTEELKDRLEEKRDQLTNLRENVKKR